MRDITELPFRGLALQQNTTTKENINFMLNNVDSIPTATMLISNLTTLWLHIYKKDSNSNQNDIISYLSAIETSIFIDNKSKHFKEIRKSSFSQWHTSYPGTQTFNCHVNYSFKDLHSLQHNYLCIAKVWFISQLLPHLLVFLLGKHRESIQQVGEDRQKDHRECRCV